MPDKVPGDSPPPVTTVGVSRPPVGSSVWQQSQHLQSLPVGWAAVLLLVAAIVWAIVASRSGFDYASAAFIVVAIFVGAMFGISAWDLVVSLVARRRGETLRLPYTITLDLPRSLVPILTPIAFLGGIVIGHLVWH